MKKILTLYIALLCAISSAQGSDITQEKSISDLLEQLDINNLQDNRDGKSLATVLEQAYYQNESILTAQNDIRVSNEGYAQAVGAFRPSLTLDNSVRRSKNTVKNDNFRDTTDNTQKSIALSLNYNLYNGGGDEAATSAREQHIFIARTQYQQTLQNIFSQTITSYLDVIYHQIISELHQQENQYLQTMLRDVQERLDFGKATRTDVMQTQARLASSDATVVSTKTKIETAKSKLFELTKYNLDHDKLPLLYFNLDLPSTKEQAIQNALQENNDIKIANHRINAKKFEERQAYAAMLPKANFSVSRSHIYNNKNTPDQNQTTQVSATLSVPLFQKGIDWSQYRSAQYQQATAKLQLNATKSKIEQEITDAYFRLEQLQATAQANEVSISANQIALDGASQEVALGARSNTELLDTVLNLLNAQIKYVNNHFEKLKLQYKIANILGILTPENLNLHINDYNPNIDFQKASTQLWGDKDNQLYQ